MIPRQNWDTLMSRNLEEVERNCLIEIDHYLESYDVFILLFYPSVGHLSSSYQKILGLMPTQ